MTKEEIEVVGDEIRCRGFTLARFDDKCPASLREEFEAMAKTGDHAAGELKPAPCSRYKQLVGKVGDKIPHRTASCKYYNATDQALPPVEKPQW